jgi:putative Ca2+/H+ antiporter (TMEM165/GDT1 family)
MGALNMDWKLLATTFGIVFLAELGDKTQLAALALTGKSGRPLSVFIGASAALVLVTFLGVAGGALLKKAVPEKVMSIGSAILFLAVGAFLLIRTLLAGNDPNAGG